jgi:hypothetical protein
MTFSSDPYDPATHWIKLVTLTSEPNVISDLTQTSVIPLRTTRNHSSETYNFPETCACSIDILILCLLPYISIMVLI